MQNEKIFYLYLFTYCITFFLFELIHGCDIRMEKRTVFDNIDCTISEVTEPGLVIIMWLCPCMPEE